MTVTKPVVNQLLEKDNVTIHPQKIEFLKHLEPCRQEPYNELLLNRTLSLVQRRCTKPCILDTSNYGKKLNMFLKQFPKCSSNEQAKCFVDALHDAGENITVKPCTKLQYRAIQSATWEDQPNQAIYILRQDIMMTVKKEYLICDVMALISFIGGVMGICIGPSLFSFSGETLDAVELAIVKICKSGIS